MTDRIKPIYFKYLSASFGTAMIASIYSIVDVAMVGQYQGPEGTAALAVVAPAWNIIYSLGLLMGAGGSVLFSIRRGGETGDGSENQYFSASCAAAFSIFSAITSSFSPAFFFALEKAVKGVGNAVIPTFPMHRSYGFQHLRHKRPRLLSPVKVGTPLGFRRKIAHKGLHAETRGLPDGALSLPSDCFARFGNPAWPGGRAANLAVLGSWPGGAPKERRKPSEQRCAHARRCSEASRPRRAA